MWVLRLSQFWTTGLDNGLKGIRDEETDISGNESQKWHYGEMRDTSEIHTECFCQPRSADLRNATINVPKSFIIC